MNIYSRVILEEAARRGIHVEILDKERNLFRLEHGGVSVRCHESLTDRTSAFTYELCADKKLTAELLGQAGYRVPRQELYADPDQARRVLEELGRLVVKPVVGEQGRGISVDVRDAETLASAVETARRFDDDVLLEECCEGRDLRLIVIDHRFVAAIERLPPSVEGDGESTVEALVEALNRRLQEETEGESKVPLDDETRRAVGLAGHAWDDVVPAGERVQVRKTANYHTGGKIVDVTEQVSAPIREAAEGMSRALEIPVVGFDFLVPDFGGSDYVVIEANERPGLANHEPQPVPQRFLDFLFPETADERPAETPAASPSD